MRSEYDLEERFVPGSLRGYRTWKISSEMKLTAINDSFMSWQRGRNEAVCTSVFERMPAKDHKFDPQCTCGFYARYAHDDIIDTFNWTTITHMVAGAIKGTGKVVQGTRGYRAEYAQIEAICPVLTVDFPFSSHESAASYQEAVKYLAVVYGVPWYPTMDDLIKDFPPEKDPISPELRAKATEIEAQLKKLKEYASGKLQNVTVHIPPNTLQPGIVYHLENGMVTSQPNTFGHTNATAPYSTFVINNIGA